MTLPALAALACPNCAQALDQTERRLHCPAGHSFDIAKGGYAPLLAPGANTTTGDTAGQVAAREDFLSSGVYDPLIEATARASRTDAPGVVVEPGCGTGHYLAAALAADGQREGIGLDTSKYALRRTAKRPLRGGTGERLAAVLADAWKTLPVRTGAAAAVLNVFAPRNPDEIARVLHPEGHLVVLTPQADHLRELVDALALLNVDPAKERRTAEQLAADFTPERTEEVRYPIELERGDALRLVAMGPSARHHEDSALAAAVDRLEAPIRATVSATVTRWRQHD
ncbi:class I SAM-dependent methyltransferase [Glycomyces tarimensis]